ncbi:phosphatase PAP2 family protein [Oryzomonas sagensis]|uniref:Acid phosphatase n=1 Tax=Oryzomonas sagensis TaxID=2603857 RepID=A0ABQ6TTU6_9BACT|nr:phosphatase PAP2 family protein [Oryzomonas sagensis]KAB0672466.1 phosphatase PAP2 family protein [Oryzomonas sagensis]
MGNMAPMLLCLALMAGCATVEKYDTAPTAQGRTQGYLPSKQLPDMIALLPPPPATGSTAFALDQETSHASFPLRDSARWALAIQDADLSFPAAAESFSCALNARITEQDTPRLFRLLRRTLADAGNAVSRPKDTYKRPRPFMVNGERICTPDYEQRLRTSGSYPSGHTTAGWTWALILSEIAPEQADAILVRGRAYGQSRIVCNVHWQSDVNEGRTVAAAVVARLHADPAFRADVEAARTELAAARAKGLLPVRDCRTEAEALALPPAAAPQPSGN